MLLRTSDDHGALLSLAQEHGTPRGSLDVPLVAMLLASVDQLLLSHDAIDYDVAWPVDYGFPRGECFSPRKQQADGMKIVATAETNTGDAPSSSSRSCFPFCLEPR